MCGMNHTASPYSARSNNHAPIVVECYQVTTIYAPHVVRPMERESNMDNLEFAKAMIKYEELYREMQALEAVITEYVMDKGENQGIGNVSALYRKGRTEYDYEAIGSKAPMFVIDKHREVIEKINWRAVCIEMSYDPPITKEPVPYVKIEVKL